MLSDPRQMPVQEQIAYFALREIWKRRNQQTPEGGQTWAEWWQKRFGRCPIEAAQDYGSRQ